MNAHVGKAFTSLTRAGKLRRVGQLAAAALSEYDVRVSSVQMHCFGTNLLYRVRSEAGERFVLRMAYPGWRTIEDLRAEAAWLEALSKDTGIGAPLVICSSCGDPIVPMSGTGVPDTWHATLMTWVDGRLLGHYLTGANLALMGELFARLHLHGKSWKPPSDFTTKRFEAFLSRGEPDAVFSGEVAQTFREDDRHAFLLARGWVESEYDALDRDDLRVIHCDLWHGNIKLDNGRLRPFDFEDTIWGYRLHDIAMGMLDLRESVGAARYKDLLASFRDGYEALLTWPKGNLDVLQLGRLLWKANYAARFRRESMSSLSEQYASVFRRFEDKGELRLPS